MHHTPSSARPLCFGSVVVLRGELDLLTAPGADRLLAEAADSHPGCDLLVDLREVTFADCAGLGPLVRAARRARERGGTVTAMVTEPRLLRLLTLTRVAEVVAVLPALDPSAATPPQQEARERAPVPDAPVGAGPAAGSPPRSGGARGAGSAGGTRPR
ncbi:STAS domain-containing protein [Peterkaempfera bronchialis]|uniref:Anti-sigma factor antagonist n=1 Tax=Peterkaempfera bronchialis TaxID=2126346 RepID=A0A345SWI7_9ACTN|nr:STAS domain-containing protein [Peterkaempfera bronchialis]AXI78092.1 anti-sigma factor antagonist [Peterkaempfera bronchialis]